MCSVSVVLHEHDGSGSEIDQSTSLSQGGLSVCAAGTALGVL